MDPTLILHRRKDQWSCLLAGIKPGKGIQVMETTTFAIDDDEALQAWVSERNISSVRVIVPGASIICRTCSLPEADPAQLDEALQLQAETRLLGTAPDHRTGTALLPAPEHVSTRTGLILAWPTSSRFAGPELEPNPLYIPDIAALASLVDGLHPRDPAIWYDRNDGTVCMVLAQQERVQVRATHEELSDPASGSDCIRQLLLESSLKAGSTPESAKDTSTRMSARLADPDRHQGLLLPESVLDSIKSRIEGASIDDAWMDQWGIAAGAALAMSDDLVPLTMFQHSIPEDSPSLMDTAVNRLSGIEVAALLSLVAVLLLAFGPMLINGGRVLTLSILHPGLSDQVADFETARDQNVMYDAMMSETWPMSKLLADIASNTPEGIELESIRIGYGEPVKIQGEAMPVPGEESAALATRMKAMFQASGVFNEVTLRWDDAETFGNRTFDISAIVSRPQYRPPYSLEQDFATWTYSERKSGQNADGEFLDDEGVAIASTGGGASSTPATPDLEFETAPSGTVTTSTPPSSNTETTSSPTSRPGSGSSRAPRTGTNGLASRGDADDRGGDLTTVPTGRIPEPLTEEQIKTFTLEASRIKLQEIAEARKQHRGNPEVSTRLQNEFKMLMSHMRELQKNEGGQ